MPVDEQAAESSTALDTASAAALAAGDVARYSEIENARDVAAKTGKATPEVPPPSTKPETAAASEAAKEVQEIAKPKNAETRKAELKAEIDELLKQRAELKKPPEPGEKLAAPPPAKTEAKEAKVEVKAGAEPVAPDIDTWAGTLQEYHAAERKYMRELSLYSAQQALVADRANQAATVANKEIESSLNDAQAEARAEFPDFDEVALSKDTPITNTMDGWILKNLKRGSMKVLYRLGENGSAEAKRIAALDVYDQADALAEIRATFTTEKAPPVKKVTTAAPAPATDLGARGSEPADKELAALSRGDTAEYMRLANLREMKARSG